MFRIAGGIVLAVIILRAIDILGFWIFGTDDWFNIIKLGVYYWG